MEITNEWLHKHCSRGTAWTAAQFKVLGILWPPYHGWKRDVLGRELSEDEAQAFASAALVIGKKTAKKRRREARQAQDDLTSDWARSVMEER